MNRDAVLRKIQLVKWSYAENDLGALRAIEASMTRYSDSARILRGNAEAEHCCSRFEIRNFEFFDHYASRLHQAEAGAIGASHA
jgi:hypothetical protein